MLTDHEEPKSFALAAYEGDTDHGHGIEAVEAAARADERQKMREPVLNAFLKYSIEYADGARPSEVVKRFTAEVFGDEKVSG